MSSASPTASTSGPGFHPAADDKIEPYVWKIAGVVILGMIMSILDTTIVNVALPTLSRDLHSSISQIQWVVTGYILSLAAVIPVTGWAARRWGAKRVYMVSLVLVTGGAGVCAAGASAPARDYANAGRRDVTALVLLSSGAVAVVYGLSELGSNSSLTAPSVVWPTLA